MELSLHSRIQPIRGKNKLLTEKENHVKKGKHFQLFMQFQ